ncbi:MAG TPA: hypothetical protein VGD39_06705, partial [Nocardioides sp.]
LPISGALGMVTLRAPDASVVRTAGEDPRCTVVKVVATCQVTGANPAPLVIEVVAPEPTAVEATLTPIVPDLDQGNNTWRARLD